MVEVDPYSFMDTITLEWLKSYSYPVTHAFQAGIIYYTLLLPTLKNLAIVLLRFIYMRAWCSGNTTAFQAVFIGSNPIARSMIIKN